MTPVRRLSRRSRLTFISQRRKETRKARLSNKRPGEGGGGTIPPGLNTYVFLSLRLKGSPTAIAAGVLFGAFVAPRRRARSEVIERMQPDTSGEKIGLDVQQQPVLWLRSERGVLN